MTKLLNYANLDHALLIADLAYIAARLSRRDNILAGMLIKWFDNRGTLSEKQEALGQNVIKSISPGQLLVKIMNQELTRLMGGAASELKISGHPAVILIAGLQGSGKTTFSAKLADRLRKQNKKVMLVACDVYRPAAIDQLKILGEVS